MSYILDALQKSANAAEPEKKPEKFPGIDTEHQPPEERPSSLALPWKLAIGAILLANIALVFLWRSDAPPSAQNPQASSAPNTPNTQINTRVSATEAAQNRGKIPLPGIVSPRDLPAPGSSANSGPARTFKPTGRAITIAGEPDPDDLIEDSSFASGTQNTPTTTNQVTSQPAAPGTKARSASALSAISDEARNILYALTFSFHIYGSESDLRSVGVNGQRRLEGQSVTADNGTTFTIAEITDSGAVIEFDHKGETLSVAIPVMEDWKDS